ERSTGFVLPAVRNEHTGRRRDGGEDRRDEDRAATPAEPPATDPRGKHRGAVALFGQNGPVRLAQDGPRTDPKLFREPAANAVILVQRVRPSLVFAERKHQLRVEPFAQRRRST